MITDDICHLIETCTGLSLRTRFRADVEHLLADIAQGDLPALLQQLGQHPPSHATWQRVLQALTIGETYFFRDAVNFQLLGQQLLPALIRQRREQNQLHLNIWCAGCSTGEEPYSVAITIAENLPDRHRWQINILGTDINQAALAHAQAGLYREWAFRQTQPGFQKRYFTETTEGWQITPHIRALVQFQPANLLDLPPVVQPWDIIFCRNVLIYLNRDHITQIEAEIFQRLQPGGWLILGQAEAIRTHRQRWMTHIFPGSVLYQKPTGHTAPSTRRYTEPAINAPGPVLHPADNGLYQAAVTALHDHNQPDEAERLLGELLTQQPHHADAHTLLAYIFASRHAMPEAHAQLDAAIHSNAMQGDAHYLRAVLYLETNETAAANQALRAALYCERKHPLATFMMGNMLAQAGDRARAIRIWETARQLTAHQPAQARVSDLSDLTVGSFHSLIQTQLNHTQRKDQG